MEEIIKTQFPVDKSEINRYVYAENTKILKSNEKFSFNNKYYSSEDESIIIKSSFNIGKLFSPIKEK